MTVFFSLGNYVDLKSQKEFWELKSILLKLTKVGKSCFTVMYGVEAIYPHSSSLLHCDFCFFSSDISGSPTGKYRGFTHNAPAFSNVASSHILAVRIVALNPCG